MAYEYHCGSCIEFKDYRDCTTAYSKEAPSYEKGYCSVYRCYYYPDDNCSLYYKNRENYSPSGCYITTIVCKLLGFDDDCDLMNTMRNFRDNVLQKNEKYIDLLYTYDVIGPVIADCLERDFSNNENNEIVHCLFNYYILPTVSLINENNYKDAIGRYREMTDSLIVMYAVEIQNSVIKETCDYVSFDEYDSTNGGHGKVKKLGKMPQE